MQQSRKPVETRTKERPRRRTAPPTALPRSSTAARRRTLTERPGMTTEVSIASVVRLPGRTARNSAQSRWIEFARLKAQHGQGIMEP